MLPLFFFCQSHLDHYFSLLLNKHTPSLLPSRSSKSTAPAVRILWKQPRSSKCVGSGVIHAVLGLSLSKSLECHRYGARYVPCAFKGLRPHATCRNHYTSRQNKSGLESLPCAVLWDVLWRIDMASLFCFAAANSSYESVSPLYRYSAVSAVPKDRQPVFLPSERSTPKNTSRLGSKYGFSIGSLRLLQGHVAVRDSAQPPDLRKGLLYLCNGEACLPAVSS